MLQQKATAGRTDAADRLDSGISRTMQQYAADTEEDVVVRGRVLGRMLMLMWGGASRGGDLYCASPLNSLLRSSIGTSIVLRSHHHSGYALQRPAAINPAVRYRQVLRLCGAASLGA